MMRRVIACMLGVSVVFLAAVSCADYVSEVMVDGPEAYYRFEELPGATNLIDSSNAVAHGQSTVTTNPAAFGLYSSNSIMDLSMGYLMLQTTSNGQMRLWLQLEETTNLTGGVWSNAGDAVEWLRSVPTNKAFYRVRGD